MASTAAFLLSVFFSPVTLRLLAVQAAAAAATVGGDDDAATMMFTSCLADAGVRNVTTRGSSSPAAYDAALRASIQNLRFAGAGTPKPAAVAVPASLDQLRACVRCARAAGLAVRLRSGGHSYEGLSYTTSTTTADTSFAVVDLAALARVRVDAGARTAWVESGATLGQVYRAVAEASPTLAFSAGSCPTVGSGGHIAGGGFGLLSRKHGLAGDNVVDAVLVDAEGRVLDRATMGEDVFWAIRGGGGGTWGAVYAWKLRLVDVPARVAAFVVNRAPPADAGSGKSSAVARLVAAWQRAAPKLPHEFYLSAFVGAGLPEQLNRTGVISVTFKGLYLGPRHEAIQILTSSFPEIGLSDLDPLEMTWIESVLFFSGLPHGPSTTVSDLSDRVLHKKTYFKAKSDYVRRPTPLAHLTRVVARLAERPNAYVILDPYGGAMDRFAPGDLPFPHRGGNIHGVQYLIEWTKEEDEDGRSREEYMRWLRGFYEFMGAYVANSPRAAYVNYMDLDLGTNNWSSQSDSDRLHHLRMMPTGGSGGESSPNPEVEAARVWGERYFLGNYDRLVRAKTLIDPDNVFRNEQSIPPLGLGLGGRPRSVTGSPRGVTQRYQ